MTPDRSSTLESVAEAVADGLPVDWEGLEVAEPELAEHLRLMKMFQALIAAHGSLREKTQRS